MIRYRKNCITCKNQLVVELSDDEVMAIEHNIPLHLCVPNLDYEKKRWIATGVCPDCDLEELTRIELHESHKEESPPSDP